MSIIANIKTYLLNGLTDWDSFKQSYIIKTSAKQVYKLGRLIDLSRFATLHIRELKRPKFSDYFIKEGPKGALQPLRFI
jgi:hypothetical protein